MLRTYPPSGHDIVLPYLVTNAEEVHEFELIANECGAEYYEFVLHNDRDDAIKRLLRRGSWGEVTSPPLTESDMPEINDLIDRMESALKDQSNSIQIIIKDRSPDETYDQILRHLA
jgi:hypothetical protein